MGGPIQAPRRAAGSESRLLSRQTRGRLPAGHPEAIRVRPGRLDEARGIQGVRHPKARLCHPLHTGTQELGPEAGQWGKRWNRPSSSGGEPATLSFTCPLPKGDLASGVSPPSWETSSSHRPWRCWRRRTLWWGESPRTPWLAPSSRGTAARKVPRTGGNSSPVSCVRRTTAIVGTSAQSGAGWGALSWPSECASTVVWQSPWPRQTSPSVSVTSPGDDWGELLRGLRSTRGEYWLWRWTGLAEQGGLAGSFSRAP